MNPVGSPRDFVLPLGIGTALFVLLLGATGLMNLASSSFLASTIASVTSVYLTHRPARKVEIVAKNDVAKGTDRPSTRSNGRSSKETGQRKRKKSGRNGDANVQIRSRAK